MAERSASQPANQHTGHQAGGENEGVMWSLWSGLGGGGGVSGGHRRHPIQMLIAPFLFLSPLSLSEGGPRHPIQMLIAPFLFLSHPFPPKF